MSIWDEKDNRLEVPYKAKTNYLCIEHPALVSNDDKALQTLGGTESVSKIYSVPVKRLPLHWRPEDIYCKATYGDRIAVTNLVMKVKKRTRKRDGKVEFQAEIFGIVETSYKFNSMCDFQYLPMTTDADGKHVDIYKKVKLECFMDREEYFNRDTPLFIPPIMLSRVDKPCDFLYRQDIEHRSHYKNPDVKRSANLIGTVRQKRSLHTIFVNFGETLPTQPIEHAVKKLTTDFVDPEGKTVISKLLEEKPVWLKVELEHRTGYKSEKLKIFLPALCFYWLDGPWRGQWNKYGFDPTKDVSAKLYQTIDFRIRQWKPGEKIMPAKRSDLQINKWTQVSRNQKHNVKINLESLGKDGEDKKIVDKEIYYKFKPDQIPPQRMMYYPANYVLIPEVQKMLHENDGQETVCTEKDGWCFKSFNFKVRDVMYDYMRRLLTLDDTVEEKFWRTKKKKRQIARLNLEGDEDDDDYDEDTLDRTSPGVEELDIEQTNTDLTELNLKK